MTLLETTLKVLVVDVFAPEELTQPSLGKRPCNNDDDPNRVRLHAGLIEQEDLEVILRQSMQEDERQQGHKLERVRGVGPFGHHLLLRRLSRRLSLVSLSYTLVLRSLGMFFYPNTFFYFVH